MFEYSISARLRAVTAFGEARFLECLGAVARRLEAYSPSVGGTPSLYEVSVLVHARSEQEALGRWWEEVEPALERESVGSLTAAYMKLPEARAVARILSAPAGGVPGR